MTNVCPKCGNDTFEVIEYSHVNITIDGNGDFVQSGNDWHLDKHEYPAKCTECGEKFDDLSDLITEDEFNSKKGD